MKTKSIKNIFALALILFTVFGCGKFEDGPKISFRSVAKRIYGVYRIEYFSKNGTDLTDYWEQYYDLTFKISKIYGISDNTLDIGVEGDIDSCGYWKFYATGYHGGFLENGSTLELVMNNYIIDTSLYPDRYIYPILIVGSDQSPVFTVSRLTNDEMWLQLTKGDDFYELHFKE